jgi:hypothetical protein
VRKLLQPMVRSRGHAAACSSEPCILMPTIESDRSSSPTPRLRSLINAQRQLTEQIHRISPFINSPHPQRPSSPQTLVHTHPFHSPNPASATPSNPTHHTQVPPIVGKGRMACMLHPTIWPHRSRQVAEAKALSAFLAVWGGFSTTSVQNENYCNV